MKAIPYLQNKADTKTYASHVPFSEESPERCTLSKQRSKEKRIQWYLES